MTEEPEGLRKKDQAVLQHISKGHTDTHQITQATTLKAHEVRYSLNKLKKLGLVELEKPEGMVERIVKGQKRVFKAPTGAQLTEKGRQCLKEHLDETVHYEDLNRAELVEKVRDLNTQVDELQQSFQIFRQQVQRRLEE